QGGVNLVVGAGSGSPFFQEGFGFMPVGIAAGGQCFAGSCLSVTDADGALSAHGVGEFKETTVLFRRDKSLVPQSSSRYVRSFGLFLTAGSSGDGATAGGCFYSFCQAAGTS